MYQQITLIGNLGRDPEMRYTPSGLPVTTFSVAVTKVTTNAEGQRNEKTIWFRVTAWRKLAETASQYLTKGSKVLIVGEVEEANAYMDKEGKPRASVEVTAQTIKFLTPRGEAAMAGGGSASAANGGSTGGGAHENDEDIPF
jgi:single-strand DNA-binding protein